MKHVGARIGDGDEAASGYLGAKGLLHALEEILLVDVRFERAAGFAGNDEESFRQIDLFFDVADLRRVSRVVDVETRVAGRLRVG